MICRIFSMICFHLCVVEVGMKCASCSLSSVDHVILDSLQSYYRP